MNKFEPTTEAIKKPEDQENYEAPRSVENPEELRQQIASEAEKQTDRFKQECADDLSRVEARAEKDRLVIDAADKNELQSLSHDAENANARLAAEINGDKHHKVDITAVEILKKAEEVMRSMTGLMGEWGHLPEDAPEVMAKLEELMIKPGAKLNKKEEWADKFKDAGEIDFAQVNEIVDRFNEEVAEKKDVSRKIEIRMEAEEVMRSMVGLQGGWEHLPEDAPEVMAKLKSLLIKESAVLDYKKWTNNYKEFDEIDFEQVRDIVEKFKIEVEANRIAEMRELQKEYSKNSETIVQKANITEIAKDKNFEESIIVKTKDEGGRIVGYEIRRNYSGELEGNKIVYMNDGSVGPVYQLHEADFAKLQKNGVLKAYGDALIKEGRSGFRSEKEKFTADFSVENKKSNIEEITEDSNFKGSVIIKTKDNEGMAVGYAIRKNSTGELEGNEIRYMSDGAVGPVYQLHEADFAKLAQSGVLAAYEDASALKNGSPERETESGEKGGREQKSKYQKWLEASRSEQHRKKREKIIEFRRELVENKKELLEIQKRIFEEIEKNPDYSVEQYLDSVKALLVGGSLSNEQQLAIRKGINAYIRQHETIQDAISDCVDEKTGNVDGGKLYGKLFNQKPQGRVEAIIGPAAIYLRTENLNDYTVGYYGGDHDSINEEMSKRADGSAGCKLTNFNVEGLENAIALEKATNGSFDNKSAYFERTLRHENQHIINSLMNEAYNAERAKAERSGNNNNKDINIEKRTKDEISAYFRDGRSPKDIRKILLNPNPNSYEYRFDYADGNREKKQLSQKYIDLVENGIVAYSHMLKEGYATEEIQAVLFTEPLSKWPKVVKRFTGRKKSVEEIKNAKDELLDANDLFEKIKSDPERYSEIIKKNIIKTTNMAELHNFLKPALHVNMKGIEIENVFSDMLSYMANGNKKFLENIPNIFGFKEKAAEFRRKLEMKNKNPMSRLWGKIVKKTYDIDEIMSS